MDRSPAISPYHRLLPIGQILDGTPMTMQPHPSLKEVVLLPLEEMLVPELPRRGEVNSSECNHCTGRENWIWADEHWHLAAGLFDTGLPFIGALATNDHLLLDTAPADVVDALGGILQRLSRAVKCIQGVERLFYQRYNDGNAHWHNQILARPSGFMQGRGAMLSLWDGVLPPIPRQMLATNCRIVAEEMASGGGKAFPYAETAQ